MTPIDVQVFPETGNRARRRYGSLKTPLWSEEKAQLIGEYIRLFTFITKHGAYIDGFAAPQYREHRDKCSAKIVLENQPPWVRDFWLCDNDSKGIQILGEIASPHISAGRSVAVVLGDFNLTVSQILESGRIGGRTATFALLDQRTFECEWNTVVQLAEYKQTLAPDALKIELFYFLASGWLDRSIAAVSSLSTEARLARWWGRDDWRGLQGMNGLDRVELIASRFKDELGYKHVVPFAIHERKRSGRTMYHMIHATDHDHAPLLMLRAYRRVSGRAGVESTKHQHHMDSLWGLPGAAGEMGVSSQGSLPL